MKIHRPVVALVAGLLAAGDARAAPVLEEATPERLLERCVGAADAEVDLPALPEPTRSDRVALVVGVPCHRLPGLPSLEFSSRDAARVGAALSEGGFSVLSLTTLVDGADLLAAVDRAEALLEPGGTLVVYFSGHGVLREQAGKLTRWLVLSDTDLERVTETAVPVSALEERLATTGAATRVVVQDTCFASGGKGLGLPAHAKGLGPVEVARLAEGDVRLWASRFFEQAIEAPERRASVYTDHLLAALRDGEADLDGDGCVGLLEAHRLAEARTIEERDGFQVPVAASVGVEDLLLACAPHPPSRAVLVSPPEGWTLELEREGEPAPVTPALAPGAYEVEVRDEGRLLHAGRLQLDAGDRLDLEAEVARARRPAAYLQAGALGRLTREFPALGARGELLVTGPGLRLRPLIGVTGAFSPNSATADARSASVSGRLGVLLSTPALPELAVGPVASAGVVWRTLLEHDRTDPGTLLGGAVAARWSFGSASVFVEPGLDVVPFDGWTRVVPIASFTAGVGVRL